MPTAADFVQMITGDAVTLDDGRSATFIRYRAGKATCIDAQGNRVNILTTPPPPPVGEATKEPANGEGVHGSSGDRGRGV